MVGGGLAGLSLSLRASKKTPVTILTKASLLDSNSYMVQGGIASVMKPPDSFESHINDTLKAGQGLCNREAVEVLVRGGPSQIAWLESQGVDFSTVGGELDLTREGGHNWRRVVHAGDFTGHEVQRVLVEKVRSNPRIQIMENTMAVDLILRKGRCVGVKAYRGASELEIYASVTVLATGGAGQLYSKTSNPSVATGDGVAMAWRAGATLTDLEFIQFHPTVLDSDESPLFLISESVRGEGGVLVNAEGEAFMAKYHPLKDLAPRDVVSRAIVTEQAKGQVYLDTTILGKSFIVSRFPNIYRECLQRGFDMAEKPIPVTPAAHYFCGGIETDLNGSTDIPNLLALGEAACTGVHGANRLASNSTLECLVFSERAVKQIPPSNEFPEVNTASTQVKPMNDGLRPKIQETMWKLVGVERDGGNLDKALRLLEKLRSKAEKRFQKNPGPISLEDLNLSTLASLVAKAAYTREESRGTHYRLDHQLKNDAEWLKHIEFKGWEIGFRPV